MNSYVHHRNLTSDLVFRLLVLNMALVIVGYALGVLTNLASVEPMRLIKYAILLVSMLHLAFYKQVALEILSRYFQFLFVLSSAFILFSAFSPSSIDAVFRVLTYLVPFLYIAYAVGYLLLSYPLLHVLHAFINAINWIYFIPVASYFLSGGKLTDTSIYQPTHPNEESAFISNHYGWASTIFLLTSLDLILNKPLPRWRRLVLSVFGVIAVYLVMISGNRTSWLSLIIVSLIFVFKYQQLFSYQKFLIALIPLGLILHLVQDPDSAVNSRIEKTRVQRKKGESRLIRSVQMIDYFNRSPSLWITGIGMFNKKKAATLTGWVGYHNSYFEVLFGAGLLVFALFFYLIVLRPGWLYFRFFSRRYLFFLPLLIIPFFESNLTGGQFLFFPWFIMAILIGYSRTFAKIRLTIKRFGSS